MIQASRQDFGQISNTLTNWGWVTHLCVSKLTTIGSDNGLSPGRRQAIIWTSVGILLMGPLGTNFSEILIAIQAFSFQKMHLKYRPWNGVQFVLGLNVLMTSKMATQLTTSVFRVHTLMAINRNDNEYFLGKSASLVDPGNLKSTHTLNRSYFMGQT